MEQTELKIAWLAGIIDGEGSIGMKKCFDNRKGRKKMSISPTIQITNCDFLLLKEVQNILTEKEIGFYFWDGSEKSRNENWSDAGNIGIGKNSEIIKLLKLVMPYLVSKKERAEILLSFCLEREPFIGKRKKDGTFSKNSVDSESYWDKLHKLNAKGNNHKKNG